MGEQGFFIVPGLLPLRDYASPEIGSALVRVVPEAKSWALLLSGSVLLLFRMQRKRRPPEVCYRASVGGRSYGATCFRAAARRYRQALWDLRVYFLQAAE